MKKRTQEFCFTANKLQICHETLLSKVQIQMFGYGYILYFSEKINRTFFQTWCGNQKQIIDIEAIGKELG